MKNFRQKDNTIVMQNIIVENIENSREFYFDILTDFHILVNSSFLIKIQNEQNLLSIKTQNPFLNSDNFNKKIILNIPSSNMEEVYNILERHKLKIDSIEKADNFIKSINSYDLSGNQLILKSLNSETTKTIFNRKKTKVLNNTNKG